LIATLALAAIALWGTIPENGFLRTIMTEDMTEVPTFLKSPFLKGIVAIIFLGGTITGIAYGVGAKTLRSDADVMNGMGKSMETLGLYIVLVFFAAQFVAYFNWTNLGLITAVKGAEGIKAAGLDQYPILLMIAFIIIAGVMNLFMGSASAKWAIMAPVFIPMFVLLGYSPEFTQVTYRIGDSVTNIISPMMSYFALIIAFLQKYDKKAGIGTLIATMIPYTFAFFIVWTILLILFMIFDLPIGPGASMMLAE
jgi:aminobenzoyl-glutamate transport protein